MLVVRSAGRSRYHSAFTNALEAIAGHCARNARPLEQVFTRRGEIISVDVTPVADFEIRIGICVAKH